MINPEPHEGLYSRRADVPRYPASITKVMTLYLACEALESDKLELTDRVVISRHAASQPPSRLGLGVGSSLTVEQAIRRSEEHTSELQSLMRISYAVFCLKKKTITTNKHTELNTYHIRN